MTRANIHAIWSLFVLITFLTLTNATQVIFQESPPIPPQNSYCPGVSPPASAARTCVAMQFPVQCNGTLQTCLQGFGTLYSNITTDQTTWDCLSVGNRVKVVDGPQCVQAVESMGSVVAAAVQNGFEKVLNALHFGGPGFMQQAVAGGQTAPPTRRSKDKTQPEHAPNPNDHPNSNSNLTPYQITALFSMLDANTTCNFQVTLELTSADQYCQVQNFFKYWVNATQWNITATPDQPMGKMDRVRVLPECLGG